MINRPDIKRAIPKRRYSLGEFIVVVLGEIESGDAADYRWILAVVREGESEPGMYLTCEAAPQSMREEGRFALRLILPDGAEIIGVGDEWGELDAFADEGIRIVKSLLDLGDQEAWRLL